MTPKFIRNVSLEEARSVQQYFNKLKAQVRLQFPGRDQIDEPLLFDFGRIVYSPSKKCLGLQLDNHSEIFGFDADSDRRVDGLYDRIERFLQENRQPSTNTRDFTADF